MIIKVNENGYVPRTLIPSISISVNAGTDFSSAELHTHDLYGTFSSGTCTWTKISGPGTVTFSDENIANPIVTVSEVGEYVLRLTAVDGASSAYDDITIFFYNTTLGTAKNECDLAAVFTTADPTTSIIKISGPGTFAAIWDTTHWDVVASAYGTYLFVLANIDNSGVRYTCNFYEQPIANPGTGGIVTGNQFTLSAVPTVGVGTWTQVAGSGTSSFSPNPNTPNATVTVSDYGLHTFRWTEVNGTCSNNAQTNVTFNE